MTSIIHALCGALLLLQGCSHPIDIIGEGDVLSASGNRDCLLEDHAAGMDNCAENLVVYDYQETYYALPRAQWTFHRLANWYGFGQSMALTYPVTLMKRVYNRPQDHSPVDHGCA